MLSCERLPALDDGNSSGWVRLLNAPPHSFWNWCQVNTFLFLANQPLSVQKTPHTVFCVAYYPYATHLIAWRVLRTVSRCPCNLFFLSKSWWFFPSLPDHIGQRLMWHVQSDGLRTCNLYGLVGKAGIMQINLNRSSTSLFQAVSHTSQNEVWSACSVVRG